MFWTLLTLSKTNKIFRRTTLLQVSGVLSLAKTSLTHGWIAAHAKSAHTVCQVPLKLDELICLLHRRPCHVTIVHMYIAITMLKGYIVELY